MHFIADDLGCLSAICDCAHDAWLDLERFFSDVGNYLRLRAEFEQYLAERGDVE